MYAHDFKGLNLVYTDMGIGINDPLRERKVERLPILQLSPENRMQY